MTRHVHLERKEDVPRLEEKSSSLYSKEPRYRMSPSAKILQGEGSFLPEWITPSVVGLRSPHKVKLSPTAVSS